MSTAKISTGARHRYLRVFTGFLLLTLLLSCSPSARVKGGDDEVRLLPYSGPRARVAVSLFEDRTAKGYDRIGEGLAAMFTTALVNSQRYIVLERDLIDEVIREQDLAAGGRVEAVTGAPWGEIEGAELLLTGAVTEFEPDRFGIGGIFVGLGTLIGSAVLHEKESSLPIGAATYRESHIALDLRLIETSSSRIVAALTVEARGKNWGGGIIGEVGGGKSRLPLAFGGFQQTATEKAIRKAVVLGVAALTLQAPARYFRHGTEDFTGGRVLGFLPLDLPRAAGAHFSTPAIRVAGSGEAWAELAAELGLSGAEAVPPVDFASRRVVLLAAGKQAEPWRRITLERVVTFPDRVEITAGLTAPLPPPPSTEREGVPPPEEESPLQPVTLIHIEGSDLPVRVRWLETEETPRSDP
jgi:curli biogenesis system outer membrane secretion channel CsgG